MRAIPLYLFLSVVVLMPDAAPAGMQSMKDSSATAALSERSKSDVSSEDRRVSVSTKTAGNISKALREIEKDSSDEAKWIDARNRCQALLSRKLSLKDRKQIQRQLEDLNIKILFSPILTEKSFLYTVQPGDSLYTIAKKNRTTMELIKRANRLKSDTIQDGKRLKISKLKFSITVEKSKNKLELFADGKLFKTYKVCTGKDNSTPVGTFTIENKIKEPVWYKDGVKIPYGDKRNILGTRWLGFSLEHYGIHGTTLPETIGTQASEGCVRMLNQDVEELYDIIPLKTTVVIVN